MLKSLYLPRFRRLSLTLGAAALAVFTIGRGAIPVTRASAATIVPSAKPAAHQALNPVAPLYFEPNVGQTDSQVRYFARAGSYTLFLTDREAVFALVEHKLKAETWRNAVKGAPLASHDAAAQDADAPSATVRIGFAGANHEPSIAGIDPLQGRVNYLIGDDASKWHTGVPTYGRVLYHSLYPGVDMVYYGTPGALEFDLRLAPGADPGVIHLALQGASGVTIDKAGNLILATPAGAVVLRKPVISEELSAGSNKPLAGRFVMLANAQQGGAKAGLTEVGFELAAHDPSHAVVIDPQFAYSSYLGGKGEGAGNLANLQIYANIQKYITVSDVALDVAAGADNTAYVAGLAYSTTSFPTVGAFQGSNHGAANKNPNAFVAKFNTGVDGTSSLVYSTFIGGSGVVKSKGLDGDQASSIAVDGNGEAYVAGTTYSTDFPTLNYLLPSGNVKDGSSKMPTPVNNGFALELNAAGNGLVYSTFIHGAKGVVPTRIALIPGCSTSCTAYITGGTKSAATIGTGKKKAVDFPVTGSGYQIKNPDTSSKSAAFLLLVSGITTGSNSNVGMTYGTYLGGAGTAAGGDSAIGLAVDSNGKAYLDGVTFSKKFPTLSAFQSVKNSASLSNAFVSEIDPSKSGVSSLVWSTYLGGAGNTKAKQGDLATAIALDHNGNVWTTGVTFSYNAAKPGFPTKNPFQADNNANPNTFQHPVCPGCPSSPAVGASNFFVTEFNPGGSLLYSTYVGGGGLVLEIPPVPDIELGDAGTGIRIDSDNNVWLTGAVTSRTNVIPGLPFPGSDGSTDGCFQDNNGTFSTGFGQGPLVTVVVFELDTGNNTIPFLTFVPGEMLEVPTALAIDGSNNLYVTGMTYSTEFPITFSSHEAAQTVNNAAGNGKGPSFIFGPGTGTTNAFLTELNPASSDCSNIDLLGGPVPAAAGGGAPQTPSAWTRP